MLRDKGVDVDGSDRGEWEWPEHGGSHARAGAASPPQLTGWSGPRHIGRPLPARAPPARTRVGEGHAR